MSTLPDPEALLVQALKSRPAVSALCGGRIGTRLSGIYPAVRVAWVGGPGRPAEGTGNPTLQYEAWGNGSGPADAVAASELARTIEGLADSLAGTYSPGTIVASHAVGSIFHTPDADGRERYIGQVGLIVQ